MRTYGYARISTVKQSIARQIDNIRAKYPDAIIVTEEFSGRTTDRPKWNKLRKSLKPGDTVVFDEVSRMSRNAEEGFKLYETLFNEGVNLVFLKERHLDTEVYRKAMDRHIELEANTGRKAVDDYIAGQGKLLNDLLLNLAKEQIEIAFQTAQHEVDFLRKRTSEGVRTAQREGKQVGRASGTKVETKKAKEAKKVIMKHSKDFNGSLNDIEVMKLTNLARNTYYKYKAEMKGTAT